MDLEYGIQKDEAAKEKYFRSHYVYFGFSKIYFSMDG